MGGEGAGMRAVLPGKRTAGFSRLKLGASRSGHAATSKTYTHSHGCGRPVAALRRGSGGVRPLRAREHSETLLVIQTTKAPHQSLP